MSTVDKMLIKGIPELRSREQERHHLLPPLNPNRRPQWRRKNCNQLLTLSLSLALSMYIYIRVCFGIYVVGYPWLCWDIGWLIFRLLLSAWSSLALASCRQMRVLVTASSMIPRSLSISPCVCVCVCTLGLGASGMRMQVMRKIIYYQLFQLWLFHNFFQKHSNQILEQLHHVINRCKNLRSRWKQIKIETLCWSSKNKEIIKTSER